MLAERSLFSTGRGVHLQMRRPIFLQSHITDESSGILGLHFWMISDRKTLQLFSGCMGVHID